MAEFKFNFEEGNSDEETGVHSSHSTLQPFPQLTDTHQAKELRMPSWLPLFPSSQVGEIVTADGSIRIKHVKESYIDQKIRDRREGFSCDVIRAIEYSSDLIPSIYEGGLKIWECCLDLVKYLAQSGANFHGKRVLEIGCGAGFPGIFALLRGAEVHFQDYNDNVIEHVTIPNVFLNLGEANEPEGTINLSPVAHEKCCFFSGDWDWLVNFINPQKHEEMMYDIILTSETIYSIESHGKLYRFIRNHLRKPHGSAYIAAKTYYFGVGGGTRSFEHLVRMDGVFDVAVCETISDGVQREILCMRYNDK